MNDNGVKGQASLLLESYLLHRKENASNTSFSSTIDTILSRIPQGSLLGSLLFNITNESKFITYADDISTFITVNDIKKQLILQI